MTRHGMVEPSAAGASPPATAPRAPMVTIDVDRATPNRMLGRQYRAEAQRSGLSASTPALPSGGRAIADISRRSKSP
ncbi:MAG: hypothetical protein E5W89_03815 [Mesorhizobium sp.]|nr:MAG: hypothetical protein E5W89_03815 [Mesorhizobium sp.]